jgi:hypothetical protein
MRHVSLEIAKSLKRMMASILSLAHSSPLSDRYSRHSHHVLEGSQSSGQTEYTTGTVQHHPPRSLSGSSLSSLTSLWAPAFRRNHDDSTPSRSSSSHNLTLRRIPTTSDRRSTSDGYSRRTSLVSVLSSRFRSEPVLGHEPAEQMLSEVIENDMEIVEVSENTYDIAEDGQSQHLSEALDHVGTVPQESDEPEIKESATSPSLPRAQRWLSTLRRRKKQALPTTTPRTQRWRLDDFDSRPSSPIKRLASQHKHSNSNSSSMAFVTAVKSATATIASMSIATISGRNSKWRRGNNRSSLISGSEPRPSIDSQRSVLDVAAKQRSRRRRAKLEELIRTEENYVADLKSLSNVSSTRCIQRDVKLTSYRLTSRCWVIIRRRPTLFDLQLRRIYPIYFTCTTKFLESCIVESHLLNTTNVLRKYHLTQLQLERMLAGTAWMSFQLEVHPIFQSSHRSDKLGVL